MNYDVIIIGAGAAGLMCAVESGKRGRKTLLVDHANSVGKKIRISGGGRCNFTNIHTSPENYLSNNPRFCVSALKRYTQFDFIDLVKKHKIKYHEKTLGQLFCDDSAQQIIDMLKSECDAANVEIMLSTKVANIKENKGGFSLFLNDKNVNCESLVVATGGPSIPKMGATSWGYDLAKKFGLNVIEPKPALVPFVLAPDILEKFKPLAGVSLFARVSCGKKTFEEGLLFTHRGLSGPSILQISSYWNEGDEIAIDFLPDLDVLQKLKEFRQNNAKQDVANSLATILPKKLANYFCDNYNIKGKNADLSNKQIEIMANLIKNYRLKPATTEGYKTAEVAKGGVDTNEISSKTFECKKINNLYFIGEVVDVTGHLGGFNFQWAWASGHACGQVV